MAQAVPAAALTPPSAADRLPRVRPRNFKSKRHWDHGFASALLLSKFMSEAVAMYNELRKQGTRPVPESDVPVCGIGEPPCEVRYCPAPPTFV
jgi:hypothetical protein